MPLRQYSIAERRRPNRLFQGFLVISLIVHAWALMHIAGIYEGRDVSYIELEMQDAGKPRGRQIPVPPHRHKPSPPCDRAPTAPADPPPMPRMIAPPAAPSAAAPTAVAAISAPAAPVISNTGMVSWTPPMDGGGGQRTAGDYFDMVRWRVESHKAYPAAAKRRQIQGRVVVRFVIAPDGSIGAVAVVAPSRYRFLDEAAVAAVTSAAPFPRPPAHLFSGPLPLEIGVVFELM
ncbi:MAG: energy transducer TonB [Pseudomonadota bacterium]